VNLYSRIIRKLLPAARNKAITRLGGGQLAAALNENVDSENETGATGHLNVPHYWAPFYHDREKRGVVRSSREGGMLIWFNDKNDDPRLNGGLYPVTKSQVRHLTKDTIRYFSQKNREKVSAYCKSTGKRRKDLTRDDYMAMNLPMIVTKQSPRHGDIGAVHDNPFFSDAPGGGMAGFNQEALPIIREVCFEHVEEFLRSTGLKDKTIVRNIALR